MKKNVIFLVLDSFIYYKIGNTEYGQSPTPFLDELKRKSLFCSNMYSQGPFTESGNKALLTGNDSLNDGGYMHNLNESENIYLEVFKKNGYETYEFFLPFYMYSNKDFRNIDHQFFTCDFMFESVYGNRLSYYANKQKERSLKDYEYRDIIRQVELTFEAWQNFLDKKNKEKYECIDRLVKNFNWDKATDMIENEKNSFEKNKKSYVDSILKLGRNHNLYKVPRVKLDDYVDDSFIKKGVYEKYKSFLSEASRKQFLSNLKNQDINYPRFFKGLLKSIKNKRIDGYTKSVVFILLCYKLMYAFRKGKFYQELPSIRKCTDILIDKLSIRRNNKPFFVHMHMEELHNRASFFTYDLNNQAYIDEEFGVYQSYFRSLNSKYKGQLLYDFALLYTDLCIKHLFDNLKRLNLLESTVVAICADHGSSYDCVPLRDIFTNNHHTENYHIPLFIYDGEMPRGICINSFHTSKDVLPTIYNKCGITPPSNISGKSVDSPDNQDEFAITEYMGGGCPDMIERPIHFMIRKNKWLVCYNVKMLEDFESGDLVEVYNTEEDPLELINLKGNNIIMKEILPYLERLKVRHKEILESFKRKYSSFI